MHSRRSFSASSYSRDHQIGSGNVITARVYSRSSSGSGFFIYHNQAVIFGFQPGGGFANDRIRPVA